MRGAPMPEVIIRPLQRADLPAALAIQSAVYPAFLVEPEDAFASRLAMQTQFCLAAWHDGALAAYLLAHGWPAQSPPPVGAILPRDAAREVLFIHDLAVGHEGRGLGLGRRLVEAALAMAAREQIDRAELIAVEGAAPYWQTLGFAPVAVTGVLRAKVAEYGAGARWMTRAIAALTPG